MTSKERVYEVSKYAETHGIEEAADYFGMTTDSVKRYMYGYNYNDSTFEQIDEPKILSIDIETLPIWASVWSTWKPTINPVDIIKDWALLSASWKWLGAKEVYNVILDPYEAAIRDDYRITSELWHVIDEADIIITYNGDKFDIKRLNAKFLEHGFPNPSPFQSIDLYKAVKEKFSNTFGKMDWVVQLLGIGMKLQHQGKELWNGCDMGEPQALQTMKEYNDHDTELTEMLYLHMLNWIPRHPNISLYYDTDKPMCHKCGSTEVYETDEKYYASASVFNLYQCPDCGSYSRYKKRSNTTDLRPV